MSQTNLSPLSICIPSKHLAINVPEEMRQLIQFLLVIAIITLPRLSTAAQPQLRFHFAGTKSIAASADASQLQKIAALPQGGPVAREIARLIAEAAGKQWIPGLTNTPAAFVDAALTAVRQETVFESFPGEGGKWRLAIRVPVKLAGELQKALRQLLTHPSVVIQDQLDANSSWRFIPKASDCATHVSYQRDWLVIDNTAATQPSEWRSAILRDGRPPQTEPGKLFAAGFRSELIQQITGFRFQKQFHVNLNSVAHKGRQRITGTVDFEAPMNLKLEEFSLPTNTLRDPLISFTVARGIAGWFKRPGFREWRLPELPNQLIAWTQSDVPIYTVLSLPMNEAAAWLKRQTARFEESLGARLASKNLGSVTNMTNYPAVVWQGLPLIAPFVTTAEKQDPDWLFFGTVPGFMPTGPNTNPPPAALLAQFKGRSDLIYYHWEVTEPRLQQWRNITDLGRIIVLNSFPANKNPYPIWLKKLEPLLGNTITEISRVNDRRWTFVRNTQIGLTALELALATHWLTPTMTFAAPPPLPGQ